MLHSCWCPAYLKDRPRACGVLQHLRTMALRQVFKRLPASSALQECALWSCGASARHFAAAPQQSEESLKKTALYDFHVQQGGKSLLVSACYISEPSLAVYCTMYKVCERAEHRSCAQLRCTLYTGILCVARLCNEATYMGFFHRCFRRVSNCAAQRVCPPKTYHLMPSRHALLN